MTFGIQSNMQHKTVQGDSYYERIIRVYTR